MVRVEEQIDVQGARAVAWALPAAGRELEGLDQGEERFRGQLGAPDRCGVEKVRLGDAGDRCSAEEGSDDQRVPQGLLQPA